MNDKMIGSSSKMLLKDRPLRIGILACVISLLGGYVLPPTMRVLIVPWWIVSVNMAFVVTAIAMIIERHVVPTTHPWTRSPLLFQASPPQGKSSVTSFHFAVTSTNNDAGDDHGANTKDSPPVPTEMQGVDYILEYIREAKQVIAEMEQAMHEEESAS